MERPKTTRGSRISSESGVQSVQKRIEYAIKGALRRLWLYYSEERKNTLENAKVPSDESSSKWKYTCFECKEAFIKKEVQVDHVNGLGLFSMDRLGEWAKELFYGQQQILCIPCHKAKSKIQAKGGWKKLGGPNEK